MTKRMFRYFTLTTAAVLFALVVYILAHAFPSSEAVRLRNALLITDSSESTGDWTPENVPSTFITEDVNVPVSIASAAHTTLQGLDSSDLGKAKALVGHLMVRVKGKGRIASLDIEKTYRAIIDEGRGYCSDIVDAYIALALSTGIPVRQWAFSFDGFGGHGHTVVEIYDRATRQWIMLDVFNNVMPLRKGSGQPLSVREFIPLFRSNEDAIIFSPIGAGRVAYSIDAKLRAYYRKGIDQWYLWNGNNVVGRGQSSAIVASLGAISEPLGELLTIALGELTIISKGRFPNIVPLASPTNTPYVERMQALRVWLLSITAICTLLVILLAVQLTLLIRQSRERRAFTKGS